MLEIIHKKENNKNIIIFIHGFKGGETTWIKEDGTKPFIDALLAESDIDANFDMGIFLYHTRLIDFYPIRRIRDYFFGNKTQKNMAIDDISRLLSTQIKYRCNEYNNVVLICHSMGGIVAKRFILDDINTSTTSKVKMYVSLATPHAGTDWATYGSLLIDNVNAKDLKPLGTTITDLTDEWVKCNNLPIRFYAQGLNDEVVPNTSSIAIDRDKQEIIFSDHDHLSIIRPNNHNDIIVVALKQELKKFLKSDKAKDWNDSSIFVDEGQFDKETFVLKLLIADVHDTLIDSSKQAFYNAEFAVRKFTAMGFDLKKLVPLYENIKNLYVLEFGKLLSSQYSDANKLVHAIHDRINSENQTSLSVVNDLYPVLNSLHKYGMLHQLSNKDINIWWAKNHTMDNLEEFKKKHN